jgi:hypothetical protein
MYLIITNIYFYLFLTLLSLSYLFLVSSLRVKFFLFTLLVILFSMWGFIYNLDGMMLVMMTAEFTILLFFLVTYLQLYSNFNFLNQKNKFNPLLIITILPIILYNFSNITLNFYNFYNSISHTVASDFFVLYLLLFSKLPFLVVIITLVISFFSFFFIVLYFNLKVTKISEKKHNKQLYFLRKQSLLKQTNFKTQLYTFQH